MEQLVLLSLKRPTLPSNRGQCLATKKQREAGEPCKHLNCRHNLIGELSRMPEREAVEIAAEHLRGHINDSCSLDVADREAPDRVVRRILGISQEELERESDSATESLRKVLRQEFPQHDPSSET